MRRKLFFTLRMLFHVFIGIPIQEQIQELAPPLEMVTFFGKRFLGIYSRQAESFEIEELKELLNIGLQKLNEVAFRNIRTYQATPVIIPEILIG